MEYKMHRAIKVATGEVIEVTDQLANDEQTLSSYGFMLQPLPAEELEEVIETVLENNATDTTGEVIEVTENNPLEYIPAQTESEEPKAKRTYNKTK